MPPAGPFIKLGGETNKERAPRPLHSLGINTLTIQYTPIRMAFKVF